MPEAIPYYVRHHCKNGVNVLFIFGSTGLLPLMRIEDRRTIAEETMGYAKGKILVAVHAGGPDTETVLELANHAKR